MLKVGEIIESNLIINWQGRYEQLVERFIVDLNYPRLLHNFEFSG